MATAKRVFARYNMLRGNVTLSRGNRAKKGLAFQQIVITSNEFDSASGTFQVYALEGKSAGPEDSLRIVSEAKLIFDEDFDGIDAADAAYSRLVHTAEQQGFEILSIIDKVALEQKRRQS